MRRLRRYIASAAFAAAVLVILAPAWAPASGILSLPPTGVTPGTYGDATHVGQFTVDATGRITAAQDVVISGGGGGGYDTIEEEGTPLTMRTTINCVGSGITCSDDAGNMVTELNVPGGSGGLSASGTFYLTDGSSNYYGPIFSMTPPGIMGGPSFSWRNQGTATETAVGSALFLNAPGASGDNIRGREVTPAGTWTLTVALLPQQISADFLSCGVYVAENGAGTLRTMGITTNVLRVDNWNSVSSINGNVFNGSLFNLPNLVMMRIQDNGTNVIYSFSTNMNQWQQVYSVGRTTFLTPDRVGYFCNGNNSNYPAATMLISWSLV